ncbi:hypothetical protein AYO20_05451 [Fonsecaea nubica]|uniref:Uncharacterized protein n=1 Tax=Fonsecaea nubica TaxID=856822 RepID=A0A178D0M6_9EURO|nr:hypothetical protein AYO20_05451 [Fonsecaea nubica]OAL35197.1 hypothetical protein AYO20_05451 [Fonsecaea nubica]
MPLNAWADTTLKAPLKQSTPFHTHELHESKSAEGSSLLEGWVHQRRNGPNPLTEDENATWQLMHGSERWSSASRESTSTTLPSTNEELKSAITALKSSTRAIERRTRILCAQDAQLKHIEEVENALDARKTRQEQDLDQKHAAEVQYIKFANEQILEDLRLTLRAEFDRVIKDSRSTPATVTELLNSDDRVLSDLNDLSSSGAQEKHEVALDALADRVNKLTRALQYFRAQTLKDRLDRAYLESLSRADIASSAQVVSDGTIDTVQEDLGSLYKEIDDVMGMVVAQEHGNALQAALQDVRRAQKQNNRSLHEKVYNQLFSLTQAVTSLSKRLESLQSRRLRLHELDVQLQHVETGARPNTKPMIEKTGTEPEDSIKPAAKALSQHLGLTPGSSDRKMSDIATTSSQLDDLILSLDTQSAGNVLRMLQLSDRAAAMRGAAVQRASEALAPHGSHELGVRELEEMIAAAKAEMERGNP